MCRAPTQTDESNMKIVRGCEGRTSRQRGGAFLRNFSLLLVACLGVVELAAPWGATTAAARASGSAAAAAAATWGRNCFPATSTRVSSSLSASNSYLDGLGSSASPGGDSPETEPLRRPDGIEVDPIKEMPPEMVAPSPPKKSVLVLSWFYANPRELKVKMKSSSSPFYFRRSSPPLKEETDNFPSSIFPTYSLLSLLSLSL